MKYKMFAVVALTVTALTADVKAACWCDTAFTGEICLNKQVTSKLNPAYWACRTMIGTFKLLCKGTFCLGRTDALRVQKGVQVDTDCTKKGNEKQCEADIEKMLMGDITDGQKDITNNLTNSLKTAVKEVEKEAKAEADRQAGCYEKTGKACAD